MGSCSRAHSARTNWSNLSHMDRFDLDLHHVLFRHASAYLLTQAWPSRDFSWISRIRKQDPTPSPSRASAFRNPRSCNELRPILSVGVVNSVLCMMKNQKPLAYIVRARTNEGPNVWPTPHTRPPRIHPLRFKPLATPSRRPSSPVTNHSGSDQMCISLSFCFVCEFKPALITHPAVV